jgi:hypothetical protein
MGDNAVDLPSYLAPDASDWRQYVEEWRLTQPELVTQFDRLQDPINHLTDTSMDDLSRTITTGLDRGYSALQIADGVVEENYSGIAGKFNDFEDWRSEMIARTEAREAFNAGGLRSYADGAVDQVEAIDGDYDERCRIRNGERFPFDPVTAEIMADASELEEHPNGGLTWGPMGSQQSLLRGIAEQDAIETARGLVNEVVSAVEQAAIQYGPANIEGGRSVSDALQAMGRPGRMTYQRDPTTGQVVRGFIANPPPASMVKLLEKTDKLIDSVHGDGLLPDLPVSATTKDMKGAGGMFGSRADGQPVYIKIRATTGENATSYLTHEIGHFLDNSALRQDGLNWATDDITAGPIAQVFAAIQNSAVYREDMALIDQIAADTAATRSPTGLFPRDATGRVIYPDNYQLSPLLKYATSNRELWARAYAQYIAEMTGDPASMATIESDVTAARVAGARASVVRYQWTVEEFEPIKEAITQMFIDLGYMAPEEA